MPTLPNRFIIKVLTMSIIIILILNIGDNFINATSTEEKNQSENSQNFQKPNHNKLGVSGVAITTNIGIRFKQNIEMPVSIYKEVMSIEELINQNEAAKTELIGKNMVAIQEYRNVLKTDIKLLITNSYNKSQILNAYIDQLEFRYTNGLESVKNLESQKIILAKSMTEANGEIELLKNKINTDFTNNDDQASIENIQKYLDLKEKYYFARTYTIYINQFLTQYNFLNNYNLQLADVLINNKNALIKDSPLVIPDSTGIEGLRKLDLIRDESE